MKILHMNYAPLHTDTEYKGMARVKYRHWFYVYECIVFESNLAKTHNKDKTVTALWYNLENAEPMPLSFCRQADNWVHTIKTARECVARKDILVKLALLHGGDVL